MSDHRVLDPAQGAAPTEPAHGAGRRPEAPRRLTPRVPAALLAEVLQLIEANPPEQMKQVYTNAGIDPQQRHQVTEAPPAPSFSEVGDLLERGARNAALLNKLSPLFDL